MSASLGIDDEEVISVRVRVYSHRLYTGVCAQVRMHTCVCMCGGVRCVSVFICKVHKNGEGVHDKDMWA